MSALAGLVVLALLGVTLAGGAVAQSDGATVTVGNATGESGENVTVAVNATADGVASYETALTYDPDVVRVVRVAGGDFPEPVANVDEDAGRVNLTQVQTDAPDDPTLARITFRLEGSAGNATAISIDREATTLYDGDGEEIAIAEFESGRLTIEATGTDGSTGAASSPGSQDGEDDEEGGDGIPILIVGVVVAVVLVGAGGFLAGQKFSGS